MRIRLIPREGEAIQYTGDNAQEIADKFNLSYKEFRSSTFYKGKLHPDIQISRENYTEEVLAGDVVLEERGELSVISYPEFLDEWKVIK